MTLSSHVDDSRHAPKALGPAHRTPAQRADRGIAARAFVPPKRHADLELSSARSDPVALAERVGRSRIPDLVPLRHARMAASPFTYYRGNALGMAEDLLAGAVNAALAKAREAAQQQLAAVAGEMNLPLPPGGLGGLLG